MKNGKLQGSSHRLRRYCKSEAFPGTQVAGRVRDGRILCDIQLERAEKAVTMSHSRQAAAPRMNRIAGIRLTTMLMPFMASTVCSAFAT